MFRFRLPILLLIIALASASCEITPTPTPVPGPVTILEPQPGQVFELYESVPWSLQATSLEPIQGFQLTWCNKDQINPVSSIETDVAGESGPNGTAYYGEGSTTIHSLAPGACTVKVRAETDQQFGPWRAVTFEVEEPALTNAIHMQILSPQDGERIPLNTPWLASLEASSPWTIKYFHVQTCQLPQGEFFASIPPVPSIGGGSSGSNDYRKDLEYFGEAADKPCYLRARAFSDTPENQVSEWVEVHFSFGPSLVEINPGVPPMLPTATNTSIGPKQAPVLKNANCRAGPGTAYNETGYALKDEVVEVVGRNQDGNWVQVINPHGEGKCWLSIVVFDATFDVSALPPASYPTPPPSDEGGGEEPAPQGCLMVDAATGELRCVAPCPPAGVPARACTP